MEYMYLQAPIDQLYYDMDPSLIGCWKNGVWQALSFPR